MTERIDPKKLIQELSNEELYETAEAYFQHLPNSIPNPAEGKSVEVEVG
jgi:hypothetical protein